MHVSIVTSADVLGFSQAEPALWSVAGLWVLYLIFVALFFGGKTARVLYIIGTAGAALVGVLIVVKSLFF